MLPSYRDIVCISCQSHKDMGHLDVVSYPRAMAQGVASRGYHAPLLPLDR